MEKDFNDLVADVVKDLGQPEFHAEPWYNPVGDCIIYKKADEAVVADRIDNFLTIYRSAVDNRPIGFQIKGVAAIIREFGLQGFLVSTEEDSHVLRRVSVAALLLAAYEEGPMTMGRRMGYATAMDAPTREQSIPADELQPA
jgi:hypothetical protein